MKILEFEIDKYGPLMNAEKRAPGNFALFYGLNENGKTLTIDALIKLILGGRIKDFKQVDRVKDDPSGYLKIGFENDTVKNLPGDGDLLQITKSMDMPLTSFDFRNIFIIRNSDLSIPDEAKFYTGITDKLVGLRTGDINKVKRNLLDLGRMTPALGFKDDEKSLRLKTRLSRAKDLLQRVEKVRERLIAGNLDKLEIEVSAKERQIKNLNDRIHLFEDARNRLLYENASKLIGNMEHNILQLKNMNIFNEEDAELWSNSERELARLNNEIKDLKDREKEISLSGNTLKEEVKKIRSLSDVYERKKNTVDNEKFRLKNIQSTEHEALAAVSLGRFLLRLSVLSSIFVIPVIISWIFLNSVYIFIVGIILLIITFGLWVYELLLIIKRKRYSKIFSGIALSLSECGLEAGSIEQAFSSIGKFNEQFDRIQTELRIHESELLTIERHLKEIRESVNSCFASSEKIEKNILTLKKKSGRDSLDDYRKLLSVKKNLENERDGIINRLRGMLGIQSDTTGEIIDKIKNRINEMAVFKDKAPGMEFEQKIFDEMKEKAGNLGLEMQNMIEKSAAIAGEMSGLEEASNEILPEGNEKLFCRTVSDLNEIHARLSSFIDENERTRTAVSGAYQILTEIEAEEKNRVHELFQNESPGSVSDFFNNITNGLYTEVSYDPDNETVKVKHESGAVLAPLQLSGGAYDQLYLAVRLALAGRLLNHEKGFFILDDPFIKSDINRITKQMDILKKITETGWQTLYFTCKEEIKDILLDDIKQNSINYFEIKMDPPRLF